MNTLLYCVNAVLPVFVMVVLGKLLAMKGRLAKSFFKDINKLVYNWLIPAVLFENVYSADLYASFDPKLLATCLIGIFCFFLLSLFIAKRAFKDPRTAGAFAQGCFKGNYLLLAVPLIENILGKAELSKALMVAPFVVIEFNFLAVLTFMLCGTSGQSRGLKGLGSKILEFLKNPFILAVLLALPFGLFHIELPAIIAKPVSYLSAMGTPIALIGVGGIIEMGKFRECFKLTLWSALIKTVLTPLIMVPIAIALGFRGTELGIISILFAAPAAANSYTTALELGGDPDLAANNLLVTTAISAVVIVLMTTLLMELKLV